VRWAAGLWWVGLSSTGELPVEQQFTIIVNTFKRPDNLKASIRHYQTCAGVAAIRVVWSEQVCAAPSSREKVPPAQR